MKKKRSISTRIMSGFALVFVFMTAIVVSGIVISNTIRRDIDVNSGGEGKEMTALTGLARDLKYDVAQVQQWLTDLSLTKGADGLDEGKIKAMEYRADFKKKIGDLSAMYRDRKEQDKVSKLEEVESAFETFHENGLKMADAYVSGGDEAGNRAMKDFDAAAEALAAKLDPFVADQDKTMDSALYGIHSSAVLLQYTMMLLGVAGLLVCIGTGLFTSKKITEVLKKILATLCMSAEQVSNASSQLSASGQHLSEASTEQASTVEEISASLVQISSMTANNAESSQEANTVSTEAKDAAQKGNTTMMSMVDAMNRIQASSSQTSKIIKTIDEIAFQTNLLALNAAVEAARAGEAGKGFAVVAEEVRNLAQRSSEAARNTTDLLEGAIKNTEDGVKVAEDLTWALTDIISGAARVNEIVSEIAQASKEQAHGIQQVTSAINQMEKAVQMNSSSAEQSASAAHELFSQAKTLEDAIEDLVSLVGSVENGASAKKVQRKAPAAKAPVVKGSMPLPKAPPRMSSATGMATVPDIPQRGKTRLDPERVIPFKDSGFEDF